MPRLNFAWAKKLEASMQFVERNSITDQHSQDLDHEFLDTVPGGG